MAKIVELEGLTVFKDKCDEKFATKTDVETLDELVQANLLQIDFDAELKFDATQL